jgi:peptidoglycan/LPS O-acetylase OafA/YrhL
MQHLKSLDGIRALAVGLVMLFHFGYFAVGWIGVPIFFVLSGYLITSILLQTRSQSFTAYIGAFYWNRALRIFPLHYAFILVSAIVYALFGVPKSIRDDWVWLASFSANFARMRSGDLGPCFVQVKEAASRHREFIGRPRGRKRCICG